MKLKQYILETLAENANSLSAGDKSMMLAARWGLLPDLIARGYDDNDDENDDWKTLWEAHRDAGHPQPVYEITYNCAEAADGGAVWGYDSIFVLGYTQEECWCGCYGGEHGGQQYGWGGPSADEWVVYSDNVASRSSAIAAGFAAAYSIGMDNGMPPEPSMQDCDQPSYDTSLFAIIPSADGACEVVEVRCGVYRHPWDTAEREDCDGEAVESYYPQRWGCDWEVVADGWCESKSELIDAIRDAIDKAWEDSEWAQPNQCLHEDEDDSQMILLHYYCEIASELYDEPSEASLKNPEDGTPYVCAVGESDAMDYHLDLDQAQALALYGWAAILPELAEAWGTRHLLDSLTEVRERADAILTADAMRVWVTFGSSCLAGNCFAGTRAFLVRHGLDRIGAIRADHLIEISQHDKDRVHVLRAARAAALGIRYA